MKHLLYQRVYTWLIIAGTGMKYIGTAFLALGGLSAVIADVALCLIWYPLVYLAGWTVYAQPDMPLQYVFRRPWQTAVIIGATAIWLKVTPDPGYAVMSFIHAARYVIGTLCLLSVIALTTGGVSQHLEHNQEHLENWQRGFHEYFNRRIDS